MATSLSSQLKAIKSFQKGIPDPIRRPLTRPSILFAPKEAADIDLRSILFIALSGLEVLSEIDERYGRYKATLFSQTSLELDRGKMVQKEEEKLNQSISSYLRLLSGNFELQAAIKTLEYLIRRYEVHVFNVDELVLCALPYHDTHAFVRVVQLLDLGDKKWAFLEGVKTSGASPPRKVLVQQCIKDKGILEILCDYAKPKKEFQHARPVVCFCTAVIVESLGSVPKLDDDMVKRVLPFVFDGLNHRKGSRDHKAGALMVVGLLATRATLAHKVIQDLAFFIAKVAHNDAKQSADLPWIRVTLMAIVSLVQSQSAQIFPKKTMMLLKEIRDFAGILSGLSQEFNIQKFLYLYLESLIDYSASDSSYLSVLIDTLVTLQVKEVIEKVVSKILTYCLKSSHSKDSSNLHERGKWAKQILIVIDKCYPSELRAAVQKFLQSSKMNLKDGDSNFRTFCQMFDESLEMTSNIPVSKIWFALEHPKAEIRVAALSSIAASGILKEISSNAQELLNVQNTIIRRLHDDDLSVIQAALSVELAEIVDPSCLLGAYQEVLSRCMHIINGGTSAASQACDVAVFCLERLVLDISLHQFNYSKEVAAIIFPLLLIRRRTWKLNLKALEMAKQIQWPLYDDSHFASDPLSSGKADIFEPGRIASLNLKTIKALAETFSKNPEVHIPWLVECSSVSERARSLLLLIILQAIVFQSEDSSGVLKLYQVCSDALRDDWHEMESRCTTAPFEEFDFDEEEFCIGLVNKVSDTDVEMLNIKIHICIYWCILKACTWSNSVDDHGHLMILDKLFLFFTASPSKNMFRKHLHFLVKNCSSTPFQFLCKYFVEEGFPVEIQVESLNSLASVCSMYGSSENSSVNEDGYLQFLFGFPSLLIPLSNANKDIRTAAANCIGGIYAFWRQYDVSRLKNGNDTILSRCLLSPTFGEFLGSIVSQNKLMSSDTNFLPSFLTSMLSASCHNLLVPEDINKRFDQTSKDAILLFILSSALKFSSYGKLAVLSLFKGLGSSILKVEGVRVLLFELLEQRSKDHIQPEKSGQALSNTEIEILCLLLMACVHPPNSRVDSDTFGCVIKALKVNGLSTDGPAIVKPCITVLQNLTCPFYDGLEVEMQEELFGNLVYLFRSDNGDIRNAAREAVLRVKFSCSNILWLLGLILDPDQLNGSLKRGKREKIATRRKKNILEDLFTRQETVVYLLHSLLDILMLKKHIDKRGSLVQPLFQVLEKLISNKWHIGIVSKGDQESESSCNIPESFAGGVYYAQQTVLIILKDIADSLLLEHHRKDDNCTFNIDLLVECARSTADASTRNHVFLLLTSVAKASPRLLSAHMFDIFTVIGESAVKQIDSHSQHIIEDLISALVPCWLSGTSSIADLLQIFVKALPDVPEHRRLTLIVYLLRSLGEKNSLGMLIFHLFRSLITRTNTSMHNERSMHDLLPSSEFLSQWEYTFAVQLSRQYTCEIWFPCLVNLLQEIKVHSKHEELLSALHMAMQFVLLKLEEPELFFQLESGHNPDNLQVTFGSVLEQIVLHLQLLNTRNKQIIVSRDALKELKDCSNRVLKTITMWMTPSSYFKSMTRLLEHANGYSKKKALVLLCETVKDHGLVQKNIKDKRNIKQKFNALQLQLDENSTASFNELCLKLVHLISDTTDGSEIPLKLAAISSLEVLSKEISSDNLIFTTCLACLVKYIGSLELDISSACLRATSALINVLGSKALAHLPHIMKHMLQRAHEISSCPVKNSKYNKVETSDVVLNQKLPFLMSIVITLEAIIKNLAGFLNPYLEDILDLIVLHAEYVSSPDAKLNLKAATVRALLTEEIPARLMLPPLLNMYSNALTCGGSSVCLVFEMLSSVTDLMDRPSIGTYHVKIFDQCLKALDVRCQLPLIDDVIMIENSVINAMIVLTMKLTETMFRPLFIHCLEWADPKLEGSEVVSLDRTITFYRLVNKLVEKHRSLFIPYFKYLLDGCMRHLTEDQDVGSVALNQKRKKARHGDAHLSSKPKDVVSPKQWHLRALVLKSLYQCFLYDTMNMKFLDASNFQVLLKPIVSQIVVEPPNSTDMLPDLPSVEEVDETLVLCLGHMAVTAHSDVLWKPLNHEVLMQTRSEKNRPKILGLKVVKFLLEHLKEEYLVLLPETIPFLGELLEDVELPVKTLAQEILKEMESLSGENLEQYL